MAYRAIAEAGVLFGDRVGVGVGISMDSCLSLLHHGLLHHGSSTVSSPASSSTLPCTGSSTRSSFGSSTASGAAGTTVAASSGLAGSSSRASSVFAASSGAPPTPPVRAAVGLRAGSVEDKSMFDGGMDGEPLSEQEWRELAVVDGTASSGEAQVTGDRAQLLHQRSNRTKGLAAASSRRQQGSIGWPAGLGEDVVNKAGAAVVHGMAAGSGLLHDSVGGNTAAGSGLLHRSSSSASASPGTPTVSVTAAPGTSATSVTAAALGFAADSSASVASPGAAGTSLGVSSSLASSSGAPPTPPVRATAGQRAGSGIELSMSGGDMDGDPSDGHELNELAVNGSTVIGDGIQDGAGRWQMADATSTIG